MASADILQSEENLANYLETPKVEVIELPLDSWNLLAQAFQSMDSPMPDPSSSAILVARDQEGRILGFVVLQKILHVEPLFIFPQHQSKGVWKHLYDAVDLLETPYVVNIEHPILMSRALDRGMVEVPGKCFVKPFPDKD